MGDCRGTTNSGGTGSLPVALVRSFLAFQTGSNVQAVRRKKPSVFPSDIPVEKFFNHVAGREGNKALWPKQFADLVDDTAGIEMLYKSCDCDAGAQAEVQKDWLAVPRRTTLGALVAQPGDELHILFRIAEAQEHDSVPDAAGAHIVYRNTFLHIVDDVENEAPSPRAYSDPGSTKNGGPPSRQSCSSRIEAMQLERHGSRAGSLWGSQAGSRMGSRIGSRMGSQAGSCAGSRAGSTGPAERGRAMAADSDTEQGEEATGACSGRQLPPPDLLERPAREIPPDGHSLWLEDPGEKMSYFSGHDPMRVSHIMSFEGEHVDGSSSFELSSFEQWGRRQQQQQQELQPMQVPSPFSALPALSYQVEPGELIGNGDAYGGAGGYSSPRHVPFAELHHQKVDVPKMFQTSPQVQMHQQVFPSLPSSPLHEQQHPPASLQQQPRNMCSVPSEAPPPPPPSLPELLGRQWPQQLQAPSPGSLVCQSQHLGMGAGNEGLPVSWHSSLPPKNEQPQCPWQPRANACSGASPYEGFEQGGLHRPDHPWGAPSAPSETGWCRNTHPSSFATPSRSEEADTEDWAAQSSFGHIRLLTGVSDSMTEKLFDAISRSDIAQVTSLIHSKADLNDCTERGSHVLFRAVIKARDTTIVQLLLRKGADARFCDDQGNQVMHFWARATVGRNHLMDIGRMLVSARANVNAQRYKDGMTPIHHVIIGHNNRRGWLDFHKAVLLVSFGASVEAQTKLCQLPADLVTNDGRAATRKMQALFAYCAQRRSNRGLGMQDPGWPRCDDSKCSFCARGGGLSDGLGGKGGGFSGGPGGKGSGGFAGDVGGKGSDFPGGHGGKGVPEAGGAQMYASPQLGMGFSGPMDGPMGGMGMRPGMPNQGMMSHGMMYDGMQPMMKGAPPQMMGSPMKGGMMPPQMMGMSGKAAMPGGQSMMGKGTLRRMEDGGPPVLLLRQLPRHHADDLAWGW